MAGWLQLVTFTAIALISALIPSLETSTCAIYRESTLGNALFITAHPDDETMFFAPTILSLVSQNVSVEALCLSNGDSGGLGSMRERELYEAYSILGVENVRILAHQQIRDNITLQWDSKLLAGIIQHHLEHHKISTIFTFDEQGVSGHPNHAAIPKALALVINSGVYPGIKAYSLVTHPLPIKYSGIAAPLLIRLSHVVGWGKDTCVLARTRVSNLAGYLTTLRAMRKHDTQLVWFRWLYLAFSRYMWVNDWAPLQTA
ncbi:putative deacetylase LmbE-like domain-containing protein [Cantharellus anzutake]|uniref:putative deacetylase LmbE-like domain-containing protein n=1 Tax=Cantharellus anzutake TaxID=1750568 RepID=UPI001907D253|nr:putative deacetylase LmbE-like domain-containing protein [Cantharellus anzutake]KAF8329563.1 putative deacetylase LmbE-like domain-containing protein [Cantharellus anzutake]